MRAGNLEEGAEMDCMVYNKQYRSDPRKERKMQSEDWLRSEVEADTCGFVFHESIENNTFCPVKGTITPKFVLSSTSRGLTI